MTAIAVECTQPRRDGSGGHVHKVRLTCDIGNYEELS